ncbi:MAG: Mur ligase family protein, partial [Myxococcota bacterium]|nr:Mur ligase family protein [Myxococcota bacterium]
MTDAAASIHGAIGSMRSACVTGTNGKTTTVSMIESIVAAAGEPSARVTTIGSWVAGEMVTSDVSLDAFAATVERSVAAGVRTIAVETTSKALEAGFSWRWPAAVAVFTNLTRDHLDRHGTPERYLAAKAQLFMSLRPGATAVFNAADPASALLAQVIPPAVHGIAYAARPPDPSCAALPPALAADRVRVERTGTSVALLPSALAERLGGALRLGVLGEVNADNALAAAAACDALGYAAD